MSRTVGKSKEEEQLGARVTRCATVTRLSSHYPELSLVYLERALLRRAASLSLPFFFSLARG